MRRSTRIAATGLVAAAAITGVSAFTASNTVPTSTAGYGSAVVSGAVATKISYTTSADGATISGATITFQGDQTGNVVNAGFNSAAQRDCTVGSFLPGLLGAPGSTTATCSGFSQPTADATTFTVTVTS